MSDPRKGKWLAVSPTRKVVLEYMHHARKVPSLPLGKTMNLGPLVEARRVAQVSWVALFLKAYGLAARSHPELRRTYIPFPWPHFYEHPFSEAAILIEREVEGQNVVLGAKLRDPGSQSLGAIDERLRFWREAPVEKVGAFRLALRMGHLPWLLRRFSFWQSLYLSGFKRAKRLGTFLVSSLGNLGIEQFHPLTPHTTYLTFGVISAGGAVDVKIIYDHRVMDGRTVARCLIDVEQILTTTLLAELRAGHTGDVRAA